MNSGDPMKHRASFTGYTLVEILVVLFIISIVTSVALLMINRNQHQQIEAFANELTQVLTLAEEQAMLQPMVLGISFDEHKFQFTQLNPNADEKKSNWIPLNETVLRDYPIPHQFEVGLKINAVSKKDHEEKDNFHPQIVISTSGDLTPFTLYISKKGERPAYAIMGDADGSITHHDLS